jgi:hypothetical protein
VEESAEVEDANGVGVSAGVEDATGVDEATGVDDAAGVDDSSGVGEVTGVDEAGTEEGFEDDKTVLETTIEDEEDVTVRVIFTP